MAGSNPSVSAHRKCTTSLISWLVIDGAAAGLYGTSSTFTLASKATGRSLYGTSGVPSALTYQRPGSVSRVTYQATTWSSVWNTPLWKYGGVRAMLRSVGTLNWPHVAPPTRKSVRSGPQRPRS